MKVNRARRKGTIHPWMKAYLSVFEQPYFALSGADGRFTLKDLPPGVNTIEAWHERFGTCSQKITVGAKETKTVEFTFQQGFRLQDLEPLPLQPEAYSLKPTYGHSFATVGA